MAKRNLAAKMRAATAATIRQRRLAEGPSRTRAKAKTPADEICEDCLEEIAEAAYDKGERSADINLCGDIYSRKDCQEAARKIRRKGFRVSYGATYNCPGMFISRRTPVAHFTMHIHW